MRDEFQRQVSAGSNEGSVDAMTAPDSIATPNRWSNTSTTELLRLLHPAEIAAIVLDDSGAVRNFTPAATRLYHLVHSDIGRPLAHIPHNFEAMPPLPSMEQLAFADGPIEAEVSDERRTFLRRITPYRPPDETSAGALVTFIDITERKLIERRLATKDAVTHALAESASLDLAAPAILEAICETCNWQVGVLWLAGDAPDGFRCLSFHCAPKRAAPALAAWCGSQELALRNDLVGTVWKTGEPAWVSNLETWLSAAPTERTGGAEARAAHDGLRSVFAFPIVLGNRRLGVFEFFADRERPTEPVLFKMSKPIGSQVGQFIERRNAERALQRSHDTFLNLIQNAPFGILLVDDSLTVTRASAGAERLFSSARPLLGRRVDEVLRILWCEPFASAMSRELRNTLVDGRSFHRSCAKQRRADTGREEAYNWQFERITMPDGINGVVCYFYDMTEYLRTQEALRESEQRYRAVVESQTEMVCRFRTDGTILFANEAYARAIGKCTADLVDLNFWTIIAPEDRANVAACLQRLSPSEPEVRIENRVLTKDGTRWFLWTNRALEFDERGRCVEAQSTGVDITDRKAAESQRQLLIDELNHRVKNTLAVVQGIAQQTITRDASPIEARNAFYGRLAALGAAHGLLSQQNWERVDLEHLVRNSIEASGAAKDRVTIDGASVLLQPRHALAIALSLHELTTNALKHGALSNDSGKLTLSWSVVDRPEPTLHFEWREHDGPAVMAPTRRGFGLLMIERALASELGCRARVDFAPSGVRCSIELLLQPSRPAGSTA